MKRIACWLLLLLAVGCTPVFRVTTPIPVVVMGDGQLHQAACDTPSALCGGPALPAPHVGPTPAPHRFGAGFPDAVPLASLTQSGATSTQVIAWNGTSWAPANGGGSPTGTGVALVSGGSFVGAAGRVDLSSSTYVANALGLANGGTGLNTSGGLQTGNALRATSSTTLGYGALALGGGSGYVSGQLPLGNGGTGVDLSGCGAGKLVQIASGPVFACYTASGDLTLAAGGVATVPSIGGGLWSAGVAGGGIYAGYTLLVASPSTSGVVFGQAPPVSDVATTPTVISGSDAYASATVHTTGGDLDLYGGSGATSNGTSGNVRLIASQTGSGALPGIWFDLAGLNSQTIGGTSAGWQIGVPFITNFSSNGNGILTDELGAQTTTATPTTITFALGSNSFAGNLTAIVSGKVVGSSTHVSQTWTANFSDNAGTCALSTTGGAWTSTTLASTGTVAATPISVALSSCNVVATVTGTAATTWNWSMTVQGAVAGGS